MKIAIIGSGISGLGAAYGLYKSGVDITVFEKNDYIGGHSRTIDVDGEPVDTGFIVYNERNYYYLTKLFAHLGVETEPSDMSFGVRISQEDLEYSSSHMFAQCRNLVSPSFWKMVWDILKFNRHARKYLDTNKSLGKVLDTIGLGEWFRNYYLLAMGACIWSSPPKEILNFPARSFLNFFNNHGLLTVSNQPKWRTVTGGSRAYVEKLTEGFAEKIILNCAIVKVIRSSNGTVAVIDEHGKKHRFDHVVFGCHADQTVAMLEDATTSERETLGAFSYQSNEIVVHTDKSFMPKNKKAWASWVYLSEGGKDEGEQVSLTYWMNNLQNLKNARDVFITLNPDRMPDKEKIIETHQFEHPVFDETAVQAQDDFAAIQGYKNTWHCGAYQRYGFHEDGLLSAVQVLNKMGVDIPWD